MYTVLLWTVLLYYRGIAISYIRIPGHYRIRDNEIADDALARETSDSLVPAITN